MLWQNVWFGSSSKFGIYIFPWKYTCCYKKMYKRISWGLWSMQQILGDRYLLKECEIRRVGKVFPLSEIHQSKEVAQSSKMT